MLSNAKLKLLWAEAMRTALNLINISSSAPLDGNVSERVWIRKDVSYKHLRVFGYKVYVHIPKDERSKLDDKAKEFIFLGYGYEKFRYRLWDPLVRKLIWTRDVAFLEDQIVSDEEKSNEFQSSPEIDIIPILISPPIVHDNHWEAGEDSNDGLAEPIEQALSEPLALLIEP